MTRTYSRQRIKAVLRGLGFQPAGKGNGTGHEVWQDVSGRVCKPVFRKHDIPHAFLYALGKELAVKGVCTRAEFFATVKYSKN